MATTKSRARPPITIAQAWPLVTKSLLDLPGLVAAAKDADLAANEVLAIAKAWAWSHPSEAAQILVYCAVSRAEEIGL